MFYYNNNITGILFQVNCRRAASAAFQENVGRQGVEHFPMGIEVTTVADYFSLGVRSVAYLEVAPAIAKLSNEFAVTLVDHLRYSYCIITYLMLNILCLTNVFVL